MEFKLDFPVPEDVLKSSHDSGIVLLGSCFSDDMSLHFTNCGIQTESNTLGTIFHPESLASLLNASLSDSSAVSIYKREDLFFSWDSAGKIYGTSESELKNKVLSARQSLKEKLSTAKLLVVTFGTAWGYVHKEHESIVANCHKAPGTHFSKELSTSQAIVESWSRMISELTAFNPFIQIVFTVSPVRHKKDGLIENNRSKARLLEAAHRLCENSNVHYFPSYEILIDELRDYRFYAEDGVHPSTEAVKYVWGKFKKYAFSKEACDLADRVATVKRSLGHKSLHPESSADKVRRSKLESEKELLAASYPYIQWD